MTRRRGVSLCGTIVLGLALMPVVFAVTCFGLVLAAEALGLGTLSALETAVQEALVYTGLASPPPTAEPPPVQMAASLTPFLPLPTLSDTVTAAPSPTPTPSPTSSPTSTPSATPSETPSPTGTATLTPSTTTTPSPTASPSVTPPATRTRTPTASPTRTATRTETYTPVPSPSASATSGFPPTETVPPPTSDGTPTETGIPPTSTSTPTASTCDASAVASVEAQVVDLINAERVAQGLAAYGVDSRLRAAARVHAADMACNHFTSHTGSDGSSVRDRVERQGYAWSWIGENYYVGSGSAQTAFDWWMNSTPHRNNLLSPNYTQFGVGYVYDADSDYGGYFVVVFAKPG